MRARRQLPFLLIIAALVVAACGPTLPETGGMVSGTVTRGDGGALEGVTVSVNDVTATTDDQGAYGIAVSTAGTYAITATLTGYSAYTGEVTVTDGEETTHDITLAALVSGVITPTASNGTVALSPDKASYDGGEEVVLTATADSGYTFDHWSGGGHDGSTENPLTVTISGDLSITAVFVEAVTISGHVTDVRDGGGVANATVSLSDSSTATATDGSFALTVPTSTTAADLMVTGSGRATTCVPGVVADASMELSLPNSAGFNSDWSSDAPLVSTTSFAAGDTLTGTETIEISCSADPGISRYFVYLQDAPFDADWAVVDEYFNDKTDVENASHSIDTTQFPNGDTELSIVAFDNNDNITVLTIPVTIDNAVDDTAVPDALTSLNVRISTGSDFVYESISWDEVPDADGYAVYRRESADADDELVGRIAVTAFHQHNALLVPGKEITYTVKPYNSFGEGTGISRSVTPLPAVDVTLETPAHNGSDVALAPTFTWSIDSAGTMPDPLTDSNASASADLTVWDTDGSEAFAVELVDDAFTGGTHTSTETLAPGHVYSWDLDCSYTVVYYTDLDGHSYAESLASKATNGECLFVTTSSTGQ